MTLYPVITYRQNEIVRVERGDAKMDTKRLIIAIALSIVVITVYQYFFMPKPKPVPKPPAETADRVTPAGTEQETGTKPQAVAEEKSTDTGTRDLGDLTTQPKKEIKPVEEKTLGAVEEDLKGSGPQEVTVETDLFTAVFTNEGAGLKSFVLRKYLDDKKQPLDLVSQKVFEKIGMDDDISIPYPFYFSTFGEDKENKETYKMLNRESYRYDGPTTVTLHGGETREIVFKYKDVEKNLSVYKTFIIANGSYIVGLDYELVKDGKEVPDVPFIFGPDLENNISEDRAIQGGVKIVTYDGKDTSDLEFMSVKTVKLGDETIENAIGTLGSNFTWAAYDRAYFTAIFKTSPRNSVIRYSTFKETTTVLEGKEGKEQKEKKKTEFYSYMEVTNPGFVYLGPKDEDALEQVSGAIPNAHKVIDYGFLGFVAKILLKGINFVYGFIPNYGWAIVIFTIFLKILLFPLTYTSSVSMAKMQTLQPKIKAIKKKYKNMRDPEQRKKMNVETMELYKREKVNPAGGCLPMLLQLPILFAFFSLLRTCINVRHEAWIFWIKDLSLKDPIYLLPILMGASQILLQKMSPTTAEGAQQKMMYIMPVFITFIVINLPSGLTLHWFTSNLLQIGQQVIINKKIYSEKKEEEKEMRAQKRKKGGKGK